MTISSFLNRHKRKILVAGGLLASGYLIADYVKTKFYEIQDRLATERAARDNLKRRFEQNQQDATFTIMALLPTLTTQILEKYSVEHITHELQAKRSDRAKNSDTLQSQSQSQSQLSESVPSVGSLENSTSQAESPNPRSKSQLWRELKIQSLARDFALIYAVALLVFFSRLQLNILGRKNYVLSVLQASQASKDKSDAKISMIDAENLESKEADINRMYLTFSWWLLNKGWMPLADRIHEVIVDVFDPINPRQDLNLTELSDLFAKVQYSVETDAKFLSNLLPPAELETYVLEQAPRSEDFDTPSSPDFIDAPLRQLLDETADFVESPNGVEVMRKLVHAGISVLVTKLAKLYPVSELAEDPKLRLANILAGVTRQAHAMAAGSPFDPNEYVRAMVEVPELDGFSALVYSNFDWSAIEQ